MRRALYIILSAAAALAVVSCAKSLKDNQSPEEIDGGVKLSVKAMLPSFTKGHMDGADLKWDLNDQIAVFASRLGFEEELYALMEANYEILSEGGLTPQEEELGAIAAYLYLLGNTHEMSMDYLDLTSIDANGKATFTSNKLLKYWLPEARREDEMYWFFAQYPATSARLDYRSIEWRYITAVYGLPVYFPTLMVSIPTEQDGVNWFNNQILIDTGMEDIDADGNIVEDDDPAYARSSGVASYYELQNEGWLPELDNFKILTSLLQFTISIQGGVDNESAVIDHIDVMMSAEENRPMSGEDMYVTGTYPLSGILPYVLTMDEDRDIRIWNRWFEPAAPNQAGITKESADRWSVMEDAESYVRLKFESPITISATPSQTYYLVTAPTRNYTSVHDQKPRLIFTAYNTSGVATHRAIYALSGQFYDSKYDNWVWSGLEEGTKYNFNLALRPINDPSAGNAGEYDEINLN